MISNSGTDGADEPQESGLSRRHFMLGSMTLGVTAATLGLNVPEGARAVGRPVSADSSFGALKEGVPSTLQLRADADVEILPLGQTFKVRAAESTFGTDVFASVNTCGSSCRKPDASLGQPVVAPQRATGLVVHPIEVTQFYVHGDTREFSYAIRMDPATETLGAVELPSNGEGRMWLNGRMMLFLKNKADGQVLELISRTPILQEGPVSAWPPVNVTVRSQGTDEYVLVSDPHGPTVAKLHNGAITMQASTHEFLAEELKIIDYDFLDRAGEPVAAQQTTANVSGVRLTWSDIRDKLPGVVGYHVYKRASGAEALQRIGGDLDRADVVDPDFDPTRAWEYSVVPVTKDLLGYDVDGVQDRPITLGPLRMGAHG